MRRWRARLVGAEESGSGGRRGSRWREARRPARRSPAARSRRRWRRRRERDALVQVQRRARALVAGARTRTALQRARLVRAGPARPRKRRRRLYVRPQRRRVGRGGRGVRGGRGCARLRGERVGEAGEEVALGLGRARWKAGERRRRASGERAGEGGRDGERDGLVRRARLRGRGGLAASRRVDALDRLGVAARLVHERLDARCGEGHRQARPVRRERERNEDARAGPALRALASWTPSTRSIVLRRSL